MHAFCKTLAPRFAAPLVAACGLCLAAPPLWADTPGWYLGAGAGWSQPDDVNSGSSTLYFHSTEHNGFTTLGFAGYDFGRFRTEGEFDYARAGVNTLSIASDGGLGARLGVGSLSGASANPGGNITATAFMLNALMDVAPSWRFSPYLGVGAGGARLALDHFNVAGTTIADGYQTKFALQGIAGVRYNVTNRISLGLDYRYFMTKDPTFTDASGVPFHIRYHTNNAVLSVTFHFGAPPPAPQPLPEPVAAPAPPPAPVAPPVPVPPPAPNLFLVFFDFDKATLTPVGVGVVEQAAAAFKSTGVARIDLTGYTDLAGSAEYNLKLSRRRADTVRDYLVRLGIPADAITVTARGKENPRVPTADGVREPQNRRVEIVLP